MSNESMSAGQLLQQANRLRRAGRLDEAIRLMPNFLNARHWIAIAAIIYDE